VIEGAADNTVGSVTNLFDVFVLVLHEEARAYKSQQWRIKNLPAHLNSTMPFAILFDVAIGRSTCCFAAFCASASVRACFSYLLTGLSYSRDGACLDLPSLLSGLCFC